MITIEKFLKEAGYDKVLKPVPFRKILPNGYMRFAEFMNSAISKNESILGDWDCDFDGIASGKVFSLMCDAIGYSNYSMAKLTQKRHTLSPAYARSIAPYYKNIIIMDSTSNSPEILEIFEEYNVNVLVVDHHELEQNFRNNFEKSYIINPHIDEKEHNNTILCPLSAGMLMALLVDWYVKTYHPNCYSNLKGGHLVYGIMSLYSDSREMSMYNISLITNIERGIVELPPLVKFFQTAYSGFDKYFISWQCVPRINALARFDRYDIIYDLVFNNNFSDENKALIESYKLRSGDMRDAIYRSLKISICNNLVIGILDAATVDEFKRQGLNPRNFTGLVAQDLSTNYNLVGVCLMETNLSEYEGSVRDAYSRNILKIFSKHMKAVGHKPAFSIACYNTHIELIKNVIDAKIANIPVYSNKLCVDCTSSDVGSLAFTQEMQFAARFNEFTGVDIPELIVKLRINDKFTIKSCTSKDGSIPYTKATQKDIEIIDFTNTCLYKNSVVFVLPYLSANKLNFRIVKEK